MSKVTKNELLATMAVIVLVSSFYVYKLTYNENEEIPELLSKVIIQPEVTVNGYDLTDHNNKEVTSSRFTDRWTFVFFGYTNCPDICPATLSQLVLLKKRLGDIADFSDNSQYFFVSVDPQRDTTTHLASYIKYFDSQFVAMTGNNANISLFEKQFGAFHKVEKDRKSNFYSVAHSSNIFLVNPHGKLIADFEPPMDISKVVKQFDLLVNRYNSALI